MDLYSAQYIVKVDGKGGLFRGLSPRIVSSAISTVVRSKVKQVSKDFTDIMEEIIPNEVSIVRNEWMVSRLVFAESIKSSLWTPWKNHTINLYFVHFAIKIPNSLVTSDGLTNIMIS